MKTAATFYRVCCVLVLVELEDHFFWCADWKARFLGTGYVDEVFFF